MPKLTKKADTESRCPKCEGIIGIYYINGGLQKYCNDCSQPGEVLKRLDNSEFKMPFGKHINQLVSELPLGYLTWGVENLNRSMQVRFQEELTRRRKTV